MAAHIFPHDFIAATGQHVIHSTRSNSIGTDVCVVCVVTAAPRARAGSCTLSITTFQRIEWPNNYDDGISQQKLTTNECRHHRRRRRCWCWTMMKPRESEPIRIALVVARTKSNCIICLAYLMTFCVHKCTSNNRSKMKRKCKCAAPQCVCVWCVYCICNFADAHHCRHSTFRADFRLENLIRNEICLKKQIACLCCVLCCAVFAKATTQLTDGQLALFAQMKCSRYLIRLRAVPLAAPLFSKSQTFIHIHNVALYVGVLLTMRKRAHTQHMKCHIK